MPTTDQIDPTYCRERMTFETDEQFAERMKRLGDMEAFFASFPLRKNSYGDPPGSV